MSKYCSCGEVNNPFDHVCASCGEKLPRVHIDEKGDFIEEILFDDCDCKQSDKKKNLKKAA